VSVRHSGALGHLRQLAPLRAPQSMAKKIGWELKGEFGNRRKKGA